MLAAVVFITLCNQEDRREFTVQCAKLAHDDISAELQRLSR